jgi:thioesterase domain-containing protein
MNQDDSPPQHPAHSAGTTRVIAANRQWHNAELALKAARHSFERWLLAGHEDIPSPASTHAYHTHEALHEAARAITTLIETVRAEATARGTNITQRR